MRLPDGRLIEWVGARFDTWREGDPVDKFPTLVTTKINGVETVTRVFMDANEVLPHLPSSTITEDGQHRG